MTCLARNTEWVRNHREHTQRVKSEWAKRNPEKIRASNLSQHLPKASKCEFCPRRKKLERHHFDYSEPRIFVTSCKECHEWIAHYPVFD